MTKHFEAGGIDDLLRQAIKHLLKNGKDLNTSQGDTIETTDVHLLLQDPTNRLSWTASRGRLFSPLAELIWYLSGRDDAEQITYYLSRYDSMVHDGIIPGGYGSRFLGDPPHDQLAAILTLLRARPNTRRAAVQLFEAGDREAAPDNVPCTCTMQFLLRDDELSMIVFMRSNDVWFGLVHDIFCFTMIQEMLARDLGVRLGTYSHLVGSLHLYTSQRSKAETYLSEGWQTGVSVMPAMPAGSFDQVRHFLTESERSIRTGLAGPGPHESAYWRDIQRLLELFTAQRVRDEPRYEIVRASLEHRGYQTLVPPMPLTQQERL